MHKVQLTLTREEMDALMIKASRLGYDVTKYIKFLISKEAFSIVGDVPVFLLSAKAERRAEKAIKEYKEGKAVELKNIDDLDSLV